MIKTKDLFKILDSKEFKGELNELSSYAANIKQERPIVHLIAKHFNRADRNVVLEKSKVDLVVDGAKIEFKYHFDCDLPHRVEKELARCNGDVNARMNGSRSGWLACRGIYVDAINKMPDLFVWIICSRDLSKVDDDQKDQIVWSKQQSKYNQEVPYCESPERLKSGLDFLEKLSQLRNFVLSRTSVTTSCRFPSTYHFLTCEF